MEYGYFPHNFYLVVDATTTGRPVGPFIIATTSTTRTSRVAYY
jgi:hypothetical protein